MTTVLLVNSRPILSAGLRFLIEAQHDLQVVGVEASVSSACAAVASMLRPPDVVVYEDRDADRSTFEKLRQLSQRAGSPAVLLVTDEYSEDTALGALIAGARGYQPATVPTRQLVDSVRSVASGGLVLPARAHQDLVTRLRPQFDSRHRKALARLTERERRVLALLETGLSNHDIARELHIAEATVKKHLTHLLRKLGVQSRLEAALYATGSPGRDRFRGAESRASAS
ncbi:LuxR C-terminal-related transcriptional regulator [Amycolatopsis pithecellobii]|uniref:Response regulator n=1 Tax=Amycolatopsis pithecellobii TaxID=664692 RepID=A0A6N7Z8G6_9PSEU|nr:response regulator transcription factor [Amycolatopsis pithecellobii]MTD57971.1 hypothetical protein [Amycolatopsis pithecellobii]